MQKVAIQGSLFDWSAESGLDPAAVMTLQPWIKKLARRYYPKAAALNLDMDDLMQAGNLGALNAARTFCPDFNASFLTWASFSITDEIKKLCRQSAAISLDARPLGEDDSAPLSERLVDASDQAAMAETVIQANQLMSKLSRHEQKLLTWYYGLGKNRKSISLEAIGKKYGLSGQCISNRISAALNKLRRRTSRLSPAL